MKTKSAPEFERIKQVLLRKGEPDRVPFFELFSDIEGLVMTAIGKPIQNFLSSDDDEKLYNHIQYMYNM